MIEIHDLYKHYEGGLVRAVSGVSLTIARGEVCSIMGPSGCGKSTLLNLIGALDVPTSGEIHIDSAPLEEHRPFSRYRHAYIGFVFQLHHLIPNLTLAENVELPSCVNRGLSRAQRRSRALELLANVGLENRADFPACKVSGGERQRAAVARALANDPQILLADEPTGSVDTQTAKLVLDVILNRCREHGTTALLVTHDPAIAARADRVLRMRDGMLV